MRVLVTRPEAQARDTAQRLAALGHQPVVAPLAEIRALDAVLPPGHFDAAALTSANGIVHAGPGLIDALKHLPLFAVGARTAEAARRRGFADVRESAGDAAALAALVIGSLAPGARIAWLCGQTRDPAFAGILAGSGRLAEPVVTYETAEIAPVAMLDADAALVHSPKSAQRLVQAIPLETLARMRLICISRAAAGALPPQLAAKAEVAATPDEAAMLALLGPA